MNPGNLQYTRESEDQGSARCEFVFVLHRVFKRSFEGFYSLFISSLQVCKVRRAQFAERYAAGIPLFSVFGSRAAAEQFRPLQAFRRSVSRLASPFPSLASSVFTQAVSLFRRPLPAERPVASSQSARESWPLSPSCQKNFQFSGFRLCRKARCFFS